MINYLVIDVDGTFTDGGVYYDENGNEIKKFCTKDGTGIICAKAAGIKTIVLTGRECSATTRRMTELKVDHIYQNVRNKVKFMENWFCENHVAKEEVGYIGDDVNDLGPMRLCGFIGAPSDASDEVKEIANYVSGIRGGHGAVRDIIEKILKDEGIWSEVLKKAYGTGT